MAVSLDRTARGVVILHGIVGGALGAAPAALVSLLMDKPYNNPWFRDLLLCGALGGSMIGMVGALAGILHEDLRAIRRQRQASNAGEPHMERALPPAPPRSHPDLPPPSFGSSAEHEALVAGSGRAGHS